MEESARIQGRQFNESASINTAHILEKKKAPGPWVHLLAGAYVSLSYINGLYTWVLTRICSALEVSPLQL